MDLGAACRTFNVLVQEERQSLRGVVFGCLRAGRPIAEATGRRHRGRKLSTNQSFEADRLEQLRVFLVLTDNHSCFSLDSPPPCAFCRSLPAHRRCRRFADMLITSQFAAQAPKQLEVFRWLRWLENRSEGIFATSAHGRASIRFESRSVSSIFRWNSPVTALSARNSLGSKVSITPSRRAAARTPRDRATPCRSSARGA